MDFIKNIFRKKLIENNHKIKHRQKEFKQKDFENIENFGYGFERFVFDLYSDLGYDVKLNQRINKDINGSTITAQIDIIYNNFLATKFVECKFRSKSNVNFDDYSKFETTLKTFNIPVNFGEIVTNSYFDKKVIHRASECGITLIDRDALKDLSSSRMNGIRMAILAYNFSECVKNTGIMNAINNYKTRLMPFDKQLEYYVTN